MGNPEQSHDATPPGAIPIHKTRVRNGEPWGEEFSSRVMGRHDKRKDIARRSAPLANEFYEAVVTSGRFSWIGLVASTDKLKRAALSIYLLESPHGGRDAKAIDIVSAYEALSRVLRPYQRLGLYYMDGGQYSTEEAIGSIERHCADMDQEAKLVWHKALLAAAT